MVTLCAAVPMLRALLQLELRIDACNDFDGFRVFIMHWQLVGGGTGICGGLFGGGVGDSFCSNGASVRLRCVLLPQLFF